MNKKKQLIISIGLVLILVLMIVGISYAAFQYTGLGKKENTITTGAITMKYTETTNVINMTGALPTTDKTGKVRLTEGEYFDFTLSSTIQGTENINWEIAAEDVTTGDKKIDGKYIKLYLTSLSDDGTETEVMAPRVYYNDSLANTYTGRPANMMSLIKGTMTASESKKYRLRIYVDEDYNPQGDGGDLSFSIKINAYGKTGDIMPNFTVSQTLLSMGLGSKGSFDTSDTEQTFITGTDPNNYIWYSGKLWRAVSIDPSDNSVKLVTQESVSSIPYNATENSSFQGSYMEQWLNDTSVDGFLGNLRESDKFIKTDSVWNATMTTETTKPEKTTMVTDAVGLLNLYEFIMSCNNVSLQTGYLAKGKITWFTLTPASTDKIITICISIGPKNNLLRYSIKSKSDSSAAIRPSINLKNDVKIAKGNGTVNNPYRLEGDNDTKTSGTLLSTRYSGEYISFGTGENNLYRIVSHENKTGTKITSANVLTENSVKKSIYFGNNTTFSKDSIVGSFLNNEYLTNEKYLTSNQINMIEENSTWYIPKFNLGANYKLAKYQDTSLTELSSETANDTIGLLRMGELMTSKDDDTISYTNTWLLTPYTDNMVWFIMSDDRADAYISNKVQQGIKPAMNLKSNVVITGGDGTKSNPFSVKLGN